MTDPLGIRGTTIGGKYVVGDLVGKGGFSFVYRAEHTIWKAPVAIKCFQSLPQAKPEQQEALLRDFIQEGRLMATLSSKTAAIVQAHDVGLFHAPDGTAVPYMVLEWLDGRALDQVLRAERQAGLPPRSVLEAVSLLEPAASALEIVHQQGIAHRDIKPENLFVVGDARSPGVMVKVLDFGIAKVMVEHIRANAALYQTGKAITAFTPSYGAPEQFSRSHGATGPWTDVFAMALILIEVMRGGLPALPGPDYMQLAVASRDERTRPTPRTFGLDVGPAVEAVFARALAVSPADRYRSMGELWAALHAAILPDAPTWAPSRRPSQAPPAPEAGRGFEPTLPATELHARAPAAPAAVSPRTLAAVGAGTVLLIVGGYLGFGLSGSAPPAPAPPVPPTASVAPVTTPASPATAAPAAAGCPEGTAMIPGGRFTMGSDDPGFKLWQPAHPVVVDAFCLDAQEVTVEAFRACVDAGACPAPDPVPTYRRPRGQSELAHEVERAAYAELCNYGKAGRDRHPVNCVPWASADAFCAFVARRLPTEAEWEYAARGSDGRRYPWGDAPKSARRMNACGQECTRWEEEHRLPPSPRMFEADDGFAGTAPVGSFPEGRTPSGLDDMIGNVWEWTADWFETYGPEEVVNPRGAPVGDKKAIRGGGFNGGVDLWLDPAFRYHQLAAVSSHGIGFRCLTEP